MSPIRKILALFAGIAGLVTTLWGYDIYQDRQHEVVIIGPVEMYSDHELANANDSCILNPRLRGNPVYRLRPGEPVKVKRIIYGKDYMGIKVQNHEGVVGWIINGRNVGVIYPKK